MLQQSEMTYDFYINSDNEIRVALKKGYLLSISGILKQNCLMNWGWNTVEQGLISQ